MNQRRADFELLRSFARAGDQTALADVIRRHLDLVYATALRKVGDAGAAEEIAQNVFTILSRKAWRFAPDDSLPAWLYRTTLRECQSWLREELRRRRREQTAAELGTTMNTPDEQYAFNALISLLDEALLSLRGKDRTALLLRFYDSHSLREVGAALGVGEDAAQKRVASAVEKLAQFFQRRGFKTATVAVTLTALRMTTASASATTFSNVTRDVLRAAPPTLAGLLALLAWLAGFTRLQKATAFLTIATLVTIWLWNGKTKVKLVNLPEQKAQTAVVTRQSESRKPYDSFFQSHYATPSVEENTESAPSPRYVEITGKIEETYYREGDTNDVASAGRSKTISFACVTGTNEWWIEDDFLIGGEQKWFFDGTNVYNSVRKTKPTPEELQDRISRAFRLPPVPFDRVKSNLTINIWESHDGNPLGDPGVNIPWLAFCSGTYLKHHGRLIPLPDDMLRNTPDRFAYTDRTETFDDELGLPRSIDLFLSRSLFQSSFKDFYGEWNFPNQYRYIPQSILTNLPIGVLTFHYAVTESTNFLGWSFPTRFEYFQTGRRYVENGDWFHRGVGRVISMRLSTKPQNVFVPSMQQVVVDSRFRDESNHVSAIIYPTTNAIAAPTNDPALQEKFAEKVARAKRRP